MGNEQQIKGQTEQVTGKIKEEVGDAFGDKSTELEGQLDQAKGAAREGVGDAQEGLEKAGQEIDKKVDDWTK